MLHISSWKGKEVAVKIFYKIQGFLFKLIKVILFLVLFLLLSPVLVLNGLFVLYSIIGSPPNYEKQGLKGQAFYEVLEIPMSWIILLYKQFMNKEIANNDIIDSKIGKSIAKGISYTLGFILFIGAILNMCISGYYLVNRDNIVQNNIELKQENQKIKDTFKVYGKVYNSKNIIGDVYNKVDEIDEFMFEYKIEARKTEDFCIEIMDKNNYEFVNEINQDKIKTLLFKKNEYITEMNFEKGKDIEIKLKRYNSFRESKWHYFLSPLIWITTPLNPIAYFEKSKFS